MNVKARSKNGRGSKDAQNIYDSVIESWDDIKEAMVELSDDD